MQKIAVTLSLLFLSITMAFSQEVTLKEKALAEFKSEHYHEAIDLLEQAVKQTPNDAEIYYYLGWFNHYRAYDSRPLSGYDYSYSEQIFNYLDKALALNPGYGDAKYFYGAECSGNAFIAMQNYDVEKVRYYYKLANERGAYPLWLKEFGRNFLNSCDENAILFAGGNADFDVCLYLQLHENLRTDVTILPLGNIDRPWYVQFMRNGLKGAAKSIDINLTDQQIMDIHPFKWDTTTVSIQISPIDRKKFGLPQNYQFHWQVVPDLFSERMHAKSQGEKEKKRTYLSPQKAILLQIVEDNLSKRPIFFSNFCSPAFFGNLNLCFQNCGLVSRLTPILTNETEFSFDYGKMEQLFQAQNLIGLLTLKDFNLPRISGMVTSGYYNALLNLSAKYDIEKKSKAPLQLLFEKYLKIGNDTEYENEIQIELEK